MSDYVIDETKRWIGVDLDGTLFRMDGWISIDHIGEPIMPMVERIRGYLDKGYNFKIFTARASVPEPDRSKMIKAVHAALEKVGLPHFPVTNEKDFDLLEIWDDRAIEVVHNAGEFVVEAYTKMLDDHCARYVEALNKTGIVISGLAMMIPDIIEEMKRSSRDVRVPESMKNFDGHISK